jgi:phage baseplate assembly protein W
MARIKGIGVHFRCTSAGYPTAATDVDLLSDSIETILKTFPGERVYRPTFGSYLRRLLFANMSQGAAIRARSEARRAIEEWERRVVVDDVLIDITETATIKLTVIWYPRANPTRQTRTSMTFGA